MWLMLGMASDEDARVRSALSALQTWISALPTANLPDVPENLLMESGVIIASRRKLDWRTLSGAPHGYLIGGINHIKTRSARWSCPASAILLETCNTANIKVTMTYLH